MTLEGASGARVILLITINSFKTGTSCCIILKQLFALVFVVDGVNNSGSQPYSVVCCCCLLLNLTFKLSTNWIYLAKDPGVNLSLGLYISV